MRFNSEEVVTQVSALGAAVADFDMARFTVTATTNGDTGAEAKAALREVVDQLSALYESFASEGLVENRRTNVSVSPRRDFDHATRQHTLVGYQATYNLVFHSSNLDKVSLIHDSLTNIEGVQANEPTFDVKNKSELSKEAFQNAFDKCKERFESECAVLGKSASSYTVGHWNVHYSEDDRHGGGVRTMSMESAGFAADSDPIEIHTGKAEVTCNLTVAFVPKKKATKR